MENCLDTFDYKSIPLELKQQLIDYSIKAHELKVGVFAFGDVTSEVEISNEAVVNFYVIHPKLSKSFLDWCKSSQPEFIEKHYKPNNKIELLAVQVIDGPGLKTGEICVINPHSDPIRKNSMMYMLKSGGENVITSWYKFKNDQKKKIEFSVDYSSSQHSYEIDTYTKESLDLIESHQLKEDNWYIFNNSIIHGVDNISSLRIGLLLPHWGDDVSENHLAKVNPVNRQQLISDWMTHFPELNLY
jgi:hypothetical protein